MVDQGQVTAGQWVAVHGCGGLGLSAIMIADALDVRFEAIDIDDAKLEFAKKVGADEVVNATVVDSVAESIRSITKGWTYVSMDALGSAVACWNSIVGLRKRGEHIQVGLMLGDDLHPSLPMDRVIANELQIIGSHGIQAHRYPELLAMIGAGKLKPEKLIGRTISLEDSLAELPDMNSFRCIGVTVINRF